MVVLLVSSDCANQGMLSWTLLLIHRSKHHLKGPPKDVGSASARPMVLLRASWTLSTGAMVTTKTSIECCRRFVSCCLNATLCFLKTQSKVLASASAVGIQRQS